MPFTKGDQPIEQNRKGFRLEYLRKAQEMSWEALWEIHAKVRVGMTERELQKMAEEVLKSRGSPKNWHRALVRIGENTLKKFNEPSAPETVLKEDDIYFLDLGPIWEFEGLAYEGDVGDTFVTGKDPEKLAASKAARVLFDKVRSIWEKEEITGPELYRRAAEEADKLGYDLNQDVDGHRAGDFPHQIFFKGGMNEIDFKPSAGVWILEIQLRHRTLPYGAFIEDTLG